MISEGNSLKTTTTINTIAGELAPSHLSKFDLAAVWLQIPLKQYEGADVFEKNFEYYVFSMNYNWIH
jgi:hypothetical protein